ncbi:MAG: prolyl-tRNA synthetase associated domain-containing protein [Pseudomonadota bacterium]
MTHFPTLPPVPVTPQTLLDYIAACGFDVVTHEHEPLFTVDQSQELRGTMEGGHTKNLFLKDKKGRLFLLTAQESSDINLKTLHKLMGASGRFSFGSAEKMEATLGLKPGAVSALGVINDREQQVTFAIDKSLLAHEKINCHPLRNDATVTLLVSDLLVFAEHCGHKPMIVDLDVETAD